jgi:adenosylcobinamide kinase/adenosylcobinamide-phosphate guanylyltransferase
MAELRVVRSELILGGQKSGKTARAESLSAVWLDASADHRAVYIATAQAWDAEMRERIDRHRRERASRMPKMETVEEPTELAHAIGAHSRRDTLIVVDCLTLWLTAQLMLMANLRPEAPAVSNSINPGSEGAGALGATIADALRHCAGPVILISNEIGGGLVPPGRDIRAFVDALGTLNQQAAAACERVTLMSAGLPLLLKGQP